jgi:SH3 domain protein
MKKSLFAIIIMITLLAAGTAVAQTRYVSDDMTVMLRTGKGENFRITRMLKIGTPLVVLEDDDQNYLMVRTPGGEEGYVLKQYITEETPKATIITQLTRERDRLKATLANLEGDRSGLAGEMTQLRERVAGLEQELAKAEADLSTVQGQYSELQNKSKNVVELTAERDRLLAENTRFATDIGTLREENESLLLTGMIQWFLAGGGVFFFGWMIGKISKKKKGF